MLNIVTTKLSTINHGLDIDAWEYTATKHCEIFFTFKIPSCVAVASVEINGILVTEFGYGWHSDVLHRQLIPWSVTLEKGDKLTFKNSSTNTDKITAYCIVVRT